MNSDFDLAIVGSGFAGSLLAMIARQLGLSVVLLERGTHPRFAIGESSTPLANLLLETLSDRYALPRIRPLTKWGSWQAAYSHIPCGLKRGFAFFHHRQGEPFFPDPKHSNQLLVAASRCDAVADTHWFRADFDHFFVREAQNLGVEYLDSLTMRAPQFEADSLTLKLERGGKSICLRARFLVDASGPRGYLHHALNLTEIRPPHLPGTQSLFSHFSNVRRLDTLGVISENEEPPFPVDDAAVHHVFDGGWIWVLRFNNGMTSAGVAACDALATALDFSDTDHAWRRVLDRLPTVADQFRDAITKLPFRHSPRLPFCCSRMVGPVWAMLPSAAGFVDPLMSTGFALTLLGVVRLAGIFQDHWGQPDLSRYLDFYAHLTYGEWQTTERLVAALYATMADFPLFSALAMLYFAPVSFSEISIRQGRREPGASFLLDDLPGFASAAKKCCEDVLSLAEKGITPQMKVEVRERILETIAQVDLIGLGDSGRANWFSVADV